MWFYLFPAVTEVEFTLHNFVLQRKFIVVMLDILFCYVMLQLVAFSLHRFAVFAFFKIMLPILITPGQNIV
jgi:hypothetical protein